MDSNNYHNYLPSSPTSSQSHYSQSAILFSGPILRNLEKNSNLRLPATYIGVRRLGQGATRVKEDEQRYEKRKAVIAKENDNTTNSEGNSRVVDDNDDEWIPNTIDGKEDQNGKCRDAVDNNDKHESDPTSEKDRNDTIKNTSNGCDNSNSSNHQNNNDNDTIVYKVTNPDGTERRMTKQEKKQLKNELKRAKASVCKEERQIQHQQRIKVAQEEKRERRRLKKIAWRQKKQQQMQSNNDVVDNSNNNELNGAGEGQLQLQEGKNNDKVSQDSMQPPLQTSCAMKEESKQNDTLPSKENECNEELASLKEEKRGIPPAILTPAAARVAFEMGVLQMNQNEMITDTKLTNTMNEKVDTYSSQSHHCNMTTILDPVLSNQWALQLQQSMIPVEESRAKEDMRTMAYKLVPEVWKRLCPESLWISVRKQEEGEETPLEKKTNKSTNDKSISENNTTTLSKQLDTQPTPAFQHSNQHSLVLIRNPSPSYDHDAYLIFRHLHQYSNLHIACGAIFGCDFLLYDGRREDRHSFAGLRVYSNNGCGNKTHVNEACAEDDDGSVEHRVDFPLPSAYDMTGFVRTMNTARKIALTATVVRPRHHLTPSSEHDGSARILIVDLALEKVLSAPTHIRKGNTIKRRTEEDAASALGKKKQKGVL